MLRGPTYAPHLYTKAQMPGGTSGIQMLGQPCDTIPLLNFNLRIGIYNRFARLAQFKEMGWGVSQFYLHSSVLAIQISKHLLVVLMTQDWFPSCIIKSFPPSQLKELDKTFQHRWSPEGPLTQQLAKSIHLLATLAGKQKRQKALSLKKREIQKWDTRNSDNDFSCCGSIMYFSWEGHSSHYFLTRATHSPTLTSISAVRPLSPHYIQSWEGARTFVPLPHVEPQPAQ